MTDSILKVAQLHDEHTDIWYDVYEADAVAGGRVRVEVPRDVREPGNVRKHLLRKGADISELDVARGNLILAIQAGAPLISRAAVVGWRGDSSFVDYGQVIGCNDGGVLPPLRSRMTANIGVGGTLLGWQQLVGCARHSTTMILSLSAAFAAPLMRALSCPSFGLVLVGPSRCAKSTSQLLGSSVCGFGLEEHLPTPNATPAGLLETAAKFNDHMFPVNEIGAAAGGKNGKYDAVESMTYAFTGGQDTIRHSSWGGSSFSDLKVLVLMSSEVSPDEWAARAGDARDPGETARLIGVPALHGACSTVFDSFPAMPDADQPFWVEHQFGRLRDGLPFQRGTAFPAYLSELMSKPDTYMKNARQDVGTFQDAFRRDDLPRIQQDIIRKFAVVYAGGTAACAAGVLPFETTLIYEAIVRSCRAALRSLPNPDDDLRNDLLTLQAALTQTGIIDADEASTRQKKNMQQADGYYEKSGLGHTFTLRTTYFSTAFATLLRGRRVLEWLDREGCLRHQREHKSGLSTEWAQSQVTWPSGQRVRSFVLYFSAGLKILEKG